MIWKDSEKERYRRVLRILFTVCMVIGGLMTTTSVSSVHAATTRTENLDLVGTTTSQVTGDRSNDSEGWSWDNTNKILTLENGFELNYTKGEQPALKLKADSTIVLKGTATITSNHKGIEALGNLTIKSESDKNGYLKIQTNAAGSNGYLYYGIEISNPEGKEVRALNVTDNTILEV